MTMRSLMLLVFMTRPGFSDRLDHWRKHYGEQANNQEDEHPDTEAVTKEFSVEGSSRTG